MTTPSDHDHDHDHNHGHDHDHGPSAAHEADHFDERAADWDDEAKVERAVIVAAAVRADVEMDDTTRMLEYGAGTGLAIEHLVAIGAVGPVTLADPSPGMRRVMAAKVTDGRLPADAVITDLDLTGEDAPTAAFDLIIAMMALHHIADAQATLTAMGVALAPGGQLAIVDLDAEDGTFHSEIDDFSGHDGFSRQDLTGMLSEAGFATPSWRHVHEVIKHDRPFPLFLAVAGLA